MAFDFFKEANLADKRIRNQIRETPLEFSPYLSQISGSRVYLKMENQQHTGSFKYRGAANFISSLTDEEQMVGFITASTGNHANAIAKYLAIIGGKGCIYVPENASKTKIQSLCDYGVEVKYKGKDIVETENYARLIAMQMGQIYIPPYNHLKIIAGQATLAIELEKQLDPIDIVFVPVGGGGLISGVAGYMKQRDPKIKIVGCQPEASPIMYESVRAGKIVDRDSLPTLADGTAGGIEKDSMTFGFCNKYVDKFVMVTEEEIRNAMRLIYQKHQLVIEGAAALSVASFLKSNKYDKNMTVVLIISGNKIDKERFTEIVSA